MSMTTTSKIVSVDTHMNTVCSHLEKVNAPEIIMNRIGVIKNFISHAGLHSDRDKCLEMREEAVKLKNYLSVVDAPHEVRKGMDGIHTFLMSITPETSENRQASRFIRTDTA